MKRIILVLIICAVLLLMIGVYGLLSREVGIWINLTLYVSTIVGITAMMLAYYVIVKRNRIKFQRIYISYTSNDQDKAQRIVNLLSKHIFIYMGGHIEPGANLYETIPSYISSCSKCYVIVGDVISAQQKYEIQEMKRQHKIIVPILTDEAVYLPQNLREYKAITYSGFMRDLYDS